MFAFMVQTSAALDLTAVMAVAGALLLLVYQAQPVSRRRFVTVLGLAIAVGAVAVLGEITPCRILEEGSFLWYLYGCWALPGGN
jgi:multisubunit Na+/H+ antiporter MnhB subunit